MGYADKSYNWANAAKRAKAARAHTQKMATESQFAIGNVVRRSRIYDGATWKHTPWTGRREPAVSVENADSLSAILKHGVWKAAVLNFASFTNPGGKFLEGSQAQEESLCHESFLYNVLKEFDDTFYAQNRKDRNNGLYRDRALYTPEVLFARSEPSQFENRESLCDVITCAAPNKRAAAHKFPADELEKKNREALESRIRFVLSIAEENWVDTLILGAYGCGVFGQDPVEVAGIFKACLPEFDFKKVVFAIPDGANGNLKAFRKVFLG